MATIIVTTGGTIAAVAGNIYVIAASNTSNVTFTGNGIAFEVQFLANNTGSQTITFSTGTLPTVTVSSGVNIENVDFNASAAGSVIYDIGAGAVVDMVTTSTAGSDTVNLSTGSRIDDDLTTGGGNDTVTLHDGAMVDDDTIVGDDTVYDVNLGAGDDAFSAGLNVHIDGVLTGGTGNDSITADEHFAVRGLVDGGDGDDFIAFGNSATLRGGIDGGAGNDTVTLADENWVDSDSIVGNSTSYDVSLGTGNDFFSADNNAHIDGDLTGGTGNDTMLAGDHFAVSGLVDGGDGDDSIAFGNYATVRGGIGGVAGNDTIILGTNSLVVGNIDAGYGINDQNDRIEIGANSTVQGAVWAGYGDDTIRIGDGSSITGGLITSTESDGAGYLVEIGENVTIGGQIQASWGYGLGVVKIGSGSSIAGGVDGTDGVSDARGGSTYLLGDNVTMGGIIQTGDLTADLLSGGDNDTFNTRVYTEGGNDVVIMGQNAAFKSGIDMAAGYDKFTTGANSTITGNVDMGAGSADVIIGGNSTVTGSIISSPSSSTDEKASIILGDKVLVGGGIALGAGSASDAYIEIGKNSTLTGSIDAAGGATDAGTTILIHQGATVGGTISMGDVTNDKLTSEAGVKFNNWVYGESGNDVFVLGDNNTFGPGLDAGNGNDTMTIGAYDNTQNDTFQGGAGTDHAVFTEMTAAQLTQMQAALTAANWTYNAATATWLKGTTGAANITYGSASVNSWESIKLYGQRDGIVDGTAAGDSMAPGYIDHQGDIIDGADGLDDSIKSAAGNDTVDAGLGNDTVDAGDGNDSVLGGNGNDSILGGLGNDTLSGDFGNDALFGGDGTDSLSGGSDNDMLNGGAGSDMLDGGTGNDTVVAGADNDTIDGASGDDSLAGDGGDDTFLLPSGSGNDTIVGGETGETAGDTIDATGQASIYNITLTYTGNEAGTLSAATTTHTTFSEIENIYLSGGNDNVDATATSNGVNVNTGAGNDSALGGSGNDTLSGGAGADTINGGAGNDLINVGAADGAVDTVVIGNGAGHDTLTGFEAPTQNPDGTFSSHDQLDVSGLTDADSNPVNTGDVTVSSDGSGNAVLTFTNGESVTLIGVSPTLAANPDYLVALGIPDGRDGIVQGTSGADTMGPGYRDAEGDYIDGPDGDNDNIVGGAGNDSINAGLGNDTVDAGDGNDTVLGGAGDDEITGGAGNDTLDGGIGADTLNAGAGNDSIYGGNGDGISGEQGDDRLIVADNSGSYSFSGGSGNDTVDASGMTADVTLAFGMNTLSHGSDTVTFDSTEQVLLGSGNDTVLGGMGAFNVDAGAGNDSMRSGAGNDTLSGGAGNDTLNGSGMGSSGDDSLIGGSGDDTFVLSDMSLGLDTIVGGETGESHGDVINATGMMGTVDFAVNFTGNEAGSLNSSGMDTVVFSEIENIVLGSGRDTVDASATTDGVNVATGTGEDSVLGGAGNDTFDGGAGADTINGGAGNDLINVGAADGAVDTVVFNDDGGADTVSGFEAPITNPDGTVTGYDKLDVSGLTDADGNPVNTSDVTVSDDGNGNAVLTFPNGESITLVGVAPSQLDSYQELVAAGIPCFVSGTMIETIDGPKPIEQLATGDLVETLDHGFQPIRWIGSRTIGAAELAAQRNLRPVCIQANALGAGLPERDLYVSPQHRMLVQSKVAMRMFGKYEVLVAAKQLVLIDGVDIQEDVAEVTYFHMLFDQHQIVYAEGALSESLYTGPEALMTIGKEAIQEILQILPELRVLDPDNLPTPARMMVRGRLARKLAYRHHQNETPVLMSDPERKIFRQSVYA